MSYLGRANSQINCGPVDTAAFSGRLLKPVSFPDCGVPAIYASIMLRQLFQPTQTFNVLPNHIGLLYFQNVLQETLSAGRYERRGKAQDYRLIQLSTVVHYTTVTNQEVLTRDNIALRFSYYLGYAISDAELFAQTLSIEDTYGASGNAGTLVAMHSQLYVRQVIGDVQSGELSERRQTLLAEAPPASVQDALAPYGIRLESIRLRDLTFPKSIQTLFAKRLEAQISAEVQLTDARASVAAARALKNASAILANDADIRFIRLMETLRDMAKQGNHTFVLGDQLQALG